VDHKLLAAQRAAQAGDATTATQAETSGTGRSPLVLLVPLELPSRLVSIELQPLPRPEVIIHPLVSGGDIYHSPERFQFGLSKSAAKGLLNCID
jgi:hypothetical protein